MTCSPSTPAGMSTAYPAAASAYAPVRRKDSAEARSSSASLPQSAASGGKIDAACPSDTRPDRVRGTSARRSVQVPSSAAGGSSEKRSAARSAADTRRGARQVSRSRMSDSTSSVSGQSTSPVSLRNALSQASWTVSGRFRPVSSGVRPPNLARPSTRRTKNIPRDLSSGIHLAWKPSASSTMHGRYAPSDTTRAAARNVSAADSASSARNSPSLKRRERTSERNMSRFCIDGTTRSPSSSSASLNPTTSRTAESSAPPGSGTGAPSSPSGRSPRNAARPSPEISRWKVSMLRRSRRGVRRRRRPCPPA